METGNEFVQNYSSLLVNLQILTFSTTTLVVLPCVWYFSICNMYIVQFLFIFTEGQFQTIKAKSVDKFEQNKRFLWVSF